MFRHCSATLRLRHLPVLLVIVLGMLVGCTKPVPPPPPPPPPSQQQVPLPPLPQPQRIEQVQRDLSPLQGKRIVIDPGHGGRFSGAVGLRGLRESDVNLAVGLHLWGLLTEAGADVWLTRTADVDLAPDSSGSLKDDLNARAQVSNKVNADLFISVHHNSNTLDPNKNNLQIYYKLNDPGPSYDLARCLAETLGKNIPSQQVFVLPGNYRVLRETKATSILGEASFLSHRENEERLSFSNQLRCEAEDYFAGILEYFRRGVPTIVEIKPDETTLKNSFPTVEARLIGGRENQAIDPDSIALLLDGSPAPVTFNSETGRVVHIPKTPLHNGEHTFTVMARNRNGNAVPPNQARFRIALPLERMAISSTFSLLPLGEDISSRIEVQAFDKHGSPVADRTEITLTATGGRLDRAGIRTEAGSGIAYFFPPATAAEVKVTAKNNGVEAGTVIRCGSVNHALLKAAVTDRGRTPLDGVTVSASGVVIGTTDRNGLVFLRAAHTGQTSVTLSKPGFLDGEALLTFERGAFRNEAFILDPRAHGVLRNRTITIDPESWDDRFSPESGLSPDAVEKNIAVALQLQALLREVGAKTVLTRQSLDENPSLGDRLRTGEQANSEYFITVTHRTSAPSVGYYFNSLSGKELARSLAAAMEKECLIQNAPIQESADFMVIHPSCPSVIVNFGTQEKTPKETAPRQAQAIYEGLVAYLTKISAE